MGELQLRKQGQSLFISPSRSTTRQRKPLESSSNADTSNRQAYFGTGTIPTHSLKDNSNHTTLIIIYHHRMIYNMYIFDRHCQCIYYHDWHRGHTAKPTFDPHGDPLASHQSTGGGGGSTTTTTTMTDPRQGMNMSLEEEGKLVYGVVYSLRNLVKKLGKNQDGFIAYKTSHYKLHYYETLTGLKFVINSDPNVESLQQALRQIYTQIYVELVVKNPLACATIISGQVNPETMGAEGFRNGVDRFVRSLTMFDTL